MGNTGLEAEVAPPLGPLLFLRALPFAWEHPLGLSHRRPHWGRAKNHLPAPLRVAAFCPRGQLASDMFTEALGYFFPHEFLGRTQLTADLCFAITERRVSVL